jgi:hypothetical protein
MTTFTLHRRRRVPMTARRFWLAAWLGGPVVGVANGVARELLYSERVGDATAHRISTGSALALFVAYYAVLQQRRPIESDRDAAEIGAYWVALTIAFELAFGRYGDHKSWHELLHTYNLAAGELWLLVPAWLGVGPWVVRRLDRR